MDLVKRNIDNLTTLWQLVNRSAGTYTIGDVFDHGIINYSDWPNRLWFKNAPEQKDLDLVKKIISRSKKKITIPHWEIEGKDYQDLLQKNGFVKVLEQAGMSAELTRLDLNPPEIELRTVKDKNAALLWGSLFEKAFNYSIHHNLLLKSYDEIDYLIAYDGNAPVGTALIHYSGKDIIGIHSMGIIPEMRRRGYAEKIMHSMLSDAVKNGYQYATLQASEMGKGLYLKMGFKEQFVLHNYVMEHHA